jgi:hypothetical protein
MVLGDVVLVAMIDGAKRASWKAKVEVNLVDDTVESEFEALEFT